MTGLRDDEALSWCRRRGARVECDQDGWWIVTIAPGDDLWPHGQAVGGRSPAEAVQQLVWWEDNRRQAIAQRWGEAEAAQRMTGLRRG